MIKTEYNKQCLTLVEYNESLIISKRNYKHLESIYNDLKFENTHIKTERGIPETSDSNVQTVITKRDFEKIYSKFLNS
jgi:hypothetical protein